jgi:hypothetical protein
MAVADSDAEGAFLLALIVFYDFLKAYKIYWQLIA